MGMISGKTFLYVFISPPFWLIQHPSFRTFTMSDKSICIIPTNPFAVSAPQNPEGTQFIVLQKRQSTAFKALKSRYMFGWDTQQPLLSLASWRAPGFFFYFETWIRNLKRLLPKKIPREKKESGVWKTEMNTTTSVGACVYLDEYRTTNVGNRSKRNFMTTQPALSQL